MGAFPIHKLFTGLGLATVIIMVLLGAVISNFLFRGIQIDLTEHKIYTLSDATRTLLENLEDEIILNFYFSASLAETTPQLRSYADHVRQTLEKLVEISAGRLRLNVTDPIPFSDAEDDANVAGLQALPANTGGDKIYFGLEAKRESEATEDGETTTLRSEVIPFFLREKENFLEYDLARTIYKASLERDPIVGLVSNFGGLDMRFLGGPPREDPMVFTQIRNTFDVREPLLEKQGELDDIDLLLLVHPQNLTELEVYYVEQFLLAGGKALIFVDPFAESASRNPLSGAPAESSASDFNTLFSHWGLDFDSEKAVLDADLGLSVTLASNGAQTQARHLGVLGLKANNMNPNDIVTADLAVINISSVGALDLTEASTLTLTPMLNSSKRAMLTDSNRFQFLFDPNVLAQDFSASGKSYVIAARIEGEVETAFPEGPSLETTDPQEETDAEDEDAGSDADEEPRAPDMSKHLAKGALDVIVIADTDLLADNFWVRISNFFGRRIASPFADNGNFLLNAVDNLTGSAALIDVRGREGFTRPFTRVEDLRRKADADYVRKEQELQRRLSETEKELNELQAKRDSDDATSVLTSEQEERLAQFQREAAEIRKELRAVRRDLTRDIDNLGSQLKAANIVLMPFLLTLLTLLALLYRRRFRSNQGN